MERIWREWGYTRGEERVLEEAQQETGLSILCPIVPCRFPSAKRWQSHIGHLFMDRATQMSGTTQLLVKVNGWLRHSKLIREAETSFNGRPTRPCAFYARRWGLHKFVCGLRRRAHTAKSEHVRCLDVKSVPCRSGICLFCWAVATASLNLLRMLVCAIVMGAKASSGILTSFRECKWPRIPVTGSYQNNTSFLKIHHSYWPIKNNSNSIRHIWLFHKYAFILLIILWH